MPVCVHCGAPTRALYVSYGPRHIVCTRCKACGAFADPYVEHEAFIVGIDLILVKPRAYRHLLFNTSVVLSPLEQQHLKKENQEQRETNSNAERDYRPWLQVARHFVAMLLIDAYLRWFHLCSQSASTQALSQTEVLQSSIVTYVVSLRSAFSLMAVLHLVVLALCQAYVSCIRTLEGRRSAALYTCELGRFRLHHVSSALLVSNLTPVVLLGLLLLWQTNAPSDDNKKMAATGTLLLSEDDIEWVVRTLVNGLSAGVALGVVLPRNRTKVGSLATIAILVCGWTAQLSASHYLVDGQCPSLVKR